MLDRDYVPGIISQGTKHAKHDLSLDYPHDKGVLTLEPPPPCNIVVRWNTDPKTEPLRRFFIDVYAGLVELRDIVAKLGLPYTTVAQKLPYYRQAFGNPNVVRLDPSQLAVLKAREKEKRDRERELRDRESPRRNPRNPYRRRRFRMRPPGLKTVLGANLFLFYVLFSGEY